MSRTRYSILMVCTANICRSPAAQSMLSHQLAGREAAVESAGTHALDGNPIDTTMSRLLQSRGLDGMHGHRSRPIMPTMLSRYDLILCMQHEHLAQTLSLYPTGLGKVRLLGQWSDQQITDPVGQGDAVYLAALDQIQTCTTQWAQKLTNMGMIR